MKKVALILIASFISYGFLYSQSQTDYRTRNHKLNKNHKMNINGRHQVVAVPKDEMEKEVNNYLARNSKFHKTSNDDKLFIRKDKLSHDYQAMNHKLKEKPTVGNGNNNHGKNLTKFFTLLLALGILMQQ